MNDVVMVFTSKSLETMEQEGGSGNWAANKDRIKRAKWIVATRNKKSGWTQGDEDHGSAFLIGRVAGIKPAPPPESNRFVVVFDRYAELNLPNAWTGHRNPVTYTDLATLGIDPEKLEWKEFIGAAGDLEHSVVPGITPGTVIDQARAMIAHALSINPEAVKITVSL
jgi:hypothetical protein